MPLIGIMGFEVLLKQVAAFTFARIGRDLLEHQPLAVEDMVASATGITRPFVASSCPLVVVVEAFILASY